VLWGVKVEYLNYSSALSCIYSTSALNIPDKASIDTCVNTPALGAIQYFPFFELKMLPFKIQNVGKDNFELIILNFELF